MLLSIFVFVYFGGGSAKDRPHILPERRGRSPRYYYMARPVHKRGNVQKYRLSVRVFLYFYNSLRTPLISAAIRKNTIMAQPLYKLGDVHKIDMRAVRSLAEQYPKYDLNRLVYSFVCALLSPPLRVVMVIMFSCSAV